MSDPDAHIDWSLTTWSGSRREQLRRWRRLTLREKLEALEGMGDLARHFEQKRRSAKYGVADEP